MTRFFLLLGLLAVQPSWGKTLAAPVAPLAQSDGVLSKFEKEVEGVSARYGKLEEDRRILASQVDRLQGEAETLRNETRGQTNVLKEARLKGVLGDLKRSLERQAKLERQSEELRRTYEEQALSLAALYNDRLEKLLESVKGFTDPQASESTLDEVVRLTRKRTTALDAVDGLRKGGKVPASPVLPNFNILPTRDRQSLNLARGLLLDRRSEIQERLERYSLEEDEIRRQLDLQDKMRELLEDPLHPSGLDAEQRSRLERLAGRRERTRWETRLQEIRRKRDKNQVTLLQVQHYLENIEYRLGRLDRKGGKKP